MLVQRILLLAALGGCPLAASAQYGVYADFTAQRLGGLSNPPGAQAGVAYNGSVNPTGGTFGGFYDFRTLGPVRLGVDARFVHTTDTRGAQAASVGAGTRIYSALGGVRGSFHTPVKLLEPYVQLSAGLGRSDYGILTYKDPVSGKISPQPVNGLEYHVYAGVDYNLLPVVGWRVVELGYGGINPLGTYSHNYSLPSVSTGIVLRFGGK